MNSDKQKMSFGFSWTAAKASSLPLYHNYYLMSAFNLLFAWLLPWRSSSHLLHLIFIVRENDFYFFLYKVMQVIPFRLTPKPQYFRRTNIASASALARDSIQLKFNPREGH